VFRHVKVHVESTQISYQIRLSTWIMWQDTSNVYGASSSQAPYYGQQGQTPLQFYTPEANSFYSGSRSSLDGQVGAQGSIVQQGMPPGYGGNIQSSGGWWTAFGTGGLEGEPPLLEGASLCTDGCSSHQQDSRAWNQFWAHT
jgi:hypothetical protein